MKADGVTPSVLDGTDGDVMTEIPEMYVYEYTEGNYEYTYLSEIGVIENGVKAKHLLVLNIPVSIRPDNSVNVKLWFYQRDESVGCHKNP